MSDPINHPQHYTAHPAGIECIQVVEHLPFLEGNVIKYVWRWREKAGLQDLEKAKWYLDRLIANERKKQCQPPVMQSNVSNNSI